MTARRALRVGDRVRVKGTMRVGTILELRRADAYYFRRAYVEWAPGEAVMLSAVSLERIEP